MSLLLPNLHLGVQLVNLGVWSLAVVLRDQRHDFKNQDISLQLKPVVSVVIVCRSCEISTQNTAFVLSSFNCQPYKSCFIIEHQVKFFPSYS